MGNIRERYSILVVDDDTEIVKTIKEAFDRDSLDWDFYTATDLKTEESVLEYHYIDVVVQDISLPDGEGFSAINGRNNKWVNSRPKFLVLTSRTDKTTRETAFFVGGDEYLSKPFYSEELIIRIKKLLSVALSSNLRDSKSSAYFRLDKQRGIVIVEGVQVRVTELEQHILCALMSTNSYLSSIGIIELIKVRTVGKVSISAKLLQVSISRLKCKFFKQTGRKLIYSRYGKGYYLKNNQ